MRASIPLVLALAVFATACGPTVDLTRNLGVAEVGSGWQDMGIVNGQNKLVPTFSFTLTNQSDVTLPVLQINALFKREGEDDEWGSAFLTVAGSDGLEPGATSDGITVASDLGYTGTEPRAQMLQNQSFVDVRVELFAKYAGTQWVLLGEYPIMRELITK